MKRACLLSGLFTLSAFFLSACFNDPAGDAPAATTGGTVSFTKQIKPILSQKCTICHNTQVLPNRPNFETREGAMKSQVIVPGKPDESRILTVITEAHGADKAMPPVSHRLSKQEIATMRTWIEEGADWPSGWSGRVRPAFTPEE